MITNFISFVIGIITGLVAMKLIVDYKDDHVRQERARTDHFRVQYEQARENLAYYRGSANWAVITPENGIPPITIPKVFTSEDQEALNRGERVIKTRRSDERI